jgi:hypothetical protein
MMACLVAARRERIKSAARVWPLWMNGTSRALAYFTDKGHAPWLGVLGPSHGHKLRVNRNGPLLRHNAIGMCSCQPPIKRNPKISTTGTTSPTRVFRNTLGRKGHDGFPFSEKPHLDTLFGFLPAFFSIIELCLPTWLSCLATLTALENGPGSC